MGNKRQFLPWAAVLGGLSLCAPTLRAEPPTKPAKRPQVRLSWVRGVGAGGCPDQRAIEARVAQRLGYTPFDSDALRSIEASVAHRDESFQLQVHFRREDGEAVGARELALRLGVAMK